MKSKDKFNFTKFTVFSSVRFLFFSVECVSYHGISCFVCRDKKKSTGFVAEKFCSCWHGGINKKFERKLIFLLIFAIEFHRLNKLEWLSLCCFQSFRYVDISFVCRKSLIYYTKKRYCSCLTHFFFFCSI